MLWRLFATPTGWLYSMCFIDCNVRFGAFCTLCSPPSFLIGVFLLQFALLYCDDVDFRTQRLTEMR